MQIFWLLVYSLSFWLLRLLVLPEGLFDDEARQYLDASSFQWAYGKQAPLFTWLAALLRYIGFFNPAGLSLLSHIGIFITAFCFYKAVSYFYKARTALLVTGALLFMLMFSYEFYRYMVHSIWMLAISALALVLYMRLLSFTTVSNTRLLDKVISYSLFGAVLALGLLSKYNFAFFIFVLLLASLVSSLGRSLVFNSCIVCSLVAFAVFFIPHALANSSVATDHALLRSQIGVPSFSLKYFWDIYSHIIIYLVIFASLWFKQLRAVWGQLLSSAQYRLFFYVLVLSLLLPLVLVLVFQFGHFTQRWLACLHLLVVFSSFVLLSAAVPDADLLKFPSARYQRILVILIWLSTLGLKASAYLQPDFWGPHILSRPYAALAKDLSASYPEQEIYVLRDLNLYAGLKSQMKNSEVFFIRNLKTLNPASVLVYRSDSPLSESKISKLGLTRLEHSALYKHSKSISFKVVALNLASAT